MRGTRRAVIALVWLLGTGAATAITIEGVRVVGSNVISGESAINPRQANAALSGRTTTTSEATSTVAVTTTVTTEAPTTTTEAPTTVAVTEAVTTPTTARPGPTTTRKKTPATSPSTAKPPATPPPTVTTPPTSPPTTPLPTTVKVSTTTTTSPQCIQQTRQTKGGIVTACFTAQKVTVLGAAPFDGWTVEQSAFGSTAVVKFLKGHDTITVLAYWSGGPQWQITESGEG
jgi:hypothetical protein